MEDKVGLNGHQKSSLVFQDNLQTTSILVFSARFSDWWAQRSSSGADRLGSVLLGTWAI